MENLYIDIHIAFKKKIACVQYSTKITIKIGNIFLSGILFVRNFRMTVYRKDPLYHVNVTWHCSVHVCS